MPAIYFDPIPTQAARELQAGGADANGQPAERAVSDGDGNPCRHCLCEIPAGQGMLVLSWRPFSTRQPYAETGPVFLCADACDAYTGETVPEVLTTSASYMIRGYGENERIVYGTGAVVAAEDIAARAAEILSRPGTAFVHVRSASNGCFQCAIRRRSGAGAPILFG
ncbi:MAG: DUF1203 domain-containing protein [Pseudomonadota bacterium]